MYFPPFMTFLIFKESYKKVKTANSMFHIFQLSLFFFHLSIPLCCLLVTSQNYILNQQSLLARYVLPFIFYVEFLLLIDICIPCIRKTLGFPPPWSAICSFHQLKLLSISPRLFTFLKLLLLLCIWMLLSLIDGYHHSELRGRKTYYTNSW